MVYFHDTKLGFDVNIYLGMFYLEASLIILSLFEQLDLLFHPGPSVLCSRCLAQYLVPIGAP